MKTLSFILVSLCLILYIFIYSIIFFLNKLTNNKLTLLYQGKLNSSQSLPSNKSVDKCE